MPVSGDVATLMESVIFNSYIKMISESPGAKISHAPTINNMDYFYKKK